MKLRFAVPLLVSSSAALVPQYTATQPDYEKPYGGLQPLPGAEHYTVLTATEAVGTYNHQPMIARHNGAFHVDWKASAYNEDQDGQRVLYASSTDGRTWSEAVAIFPSMPAARFGCDPAAGTPLPPGPGGLHCWDKIHHENTPFVTLNGRLYAVSNVRRHGSPASFYPTPSVDINTTMLRRVLQPAMLTPGGCASMVPSAACPADSLRWTQPAFGPLFWATPVVPYGYRNCSSAFGIRASTPAALSVEEAADFALFRNTLQAPRYTPDGCRGGPCSNLTGEQAVYPVADTATDIILHRGRGGVLPNGWPGDQGCSNSTDCVLLSSSRDTSRPENPWSFPPAPTTVPDLGSNLNAGTLNEPDGRRGSTFLVWNGVPRPHVNDTACGNRPVPLRNPLTLALSSDGGRVFDTAFALFNSTVPKRFCGSAKPFGPRSAGRTFLAVSHHIATCHIATCHAKTISHTPPSVAHLVRPEAH
jgi:hypothetical protein